MFTNKKYEEMFWKIANHEDFGKRNPCEIGEECGYSIVEVEKMVHDLEESDGKRCYFPIVSFEVGALHKRFCSGEGLLEIHTNDWTACIDEFDTKIEEHISLSLYRGGVKALRGKYCVCYNSYGNKEGYYLVNLETLKVIMFIPGEEWRNAFLVEDAVLILKDSLLMRYSLRKEEKVIKLDTTGGGEAVLIEGQDSYYLTYGYKLWKISKNFDKVEKIVGFSSTIGIELDENNFFYYKKDNDTGNYKKYSEEGELLEKNYFSETKEEDYRSGVEIILSTREYQLFRGDIYQKSTKEKVAAFDEEINRYYAEYDKNIFWGVKTDEKSFLTPSFMSRRKSLEYGTVQKIELSDGVDKTDIPVKFETIINS